MRKILVSDVDHTIYFLDERDVKNSKAIKNFKENKNMVIACSGRGLNGIIETEAEMDIKFDHYILLNGAFIADKDRNVLKHEKINFVCLKGILEVVNNKKLGVCINDGYDYHLVQGVHSSLDLEEVALFKENISALAVAYMGKDDEFEELLNDCVDKINSLYGEYVVAYKNTKYIDIVPIGCSKGQAINDLEEDWKLDHKDIYTIGDSENDITMLNNKYVSFTFNNSKKFLKDMVNHVIEEFPECLEIINKE
ncbi:MAG: HAD-IIB family hydrolase [Sarcina sp.]